MAGKPPKENCSGADHDWNGNAEYGPSAAEEHYPAFQDQQRHHRYEEYRLRPRLAKQQTKGSDEPGEGADGESPGDPAGDG